MENQISIAQIFIKPEWLDHIDFNDHEQLNSKEKIDSILFGIGVNSWNRFEVFLEMEEVLCYYPKLYWYALGCAYTDSDSLKNYSDEVKDSFRSCLPYRENLMNVTERKFLKQLPENITIYRALSKIEIESEEIGISWTLSKSVAKFFLSYWRCPDVANNTEKMIIQRDIPKTEAIAYFNGRDEHEIIYLGKNKTFKKIRL